MDARKYHCLSDDQMTIIDGLSPRYVRAVNRADALLKSLEGSEGAKRRRILKSIESKKAEIEILREDIHKRYGPHSQGKHIAPRTRRRHRSIGFHF